jgi:hypothetical protein
MILTTVFVVSLDAQNRFEGYNVILSVPDNHTEATCALRYAPPSTTITINDLNAATPMRVSSCSGSAARVVQAGSTATMKSNSTDSKWCFQGEDKSYRISFAGDKFSGAVSYNWIATPSEKELGFYNAKDFGAVGDGSADDTVAIKSALAFIATQNGGVLRFPQGEYIVTSPIALPSGVTIEGASGLNSNASTNNVVQRAATRITLLGSDRALFRIGECVEKVVVKDIELYARSSNKTYGIEASGAWLSSQDFYFERVAFSNFYRGIFAHGLPQTNLNWQFDFIKINHCRFIYNTDAGIYVDIRNTDWRIASSFFVNPQRTSTQQANSMHFERVGMVEVLDTFGGGFSNARGGTFLDILDSGPVTVIGSQTESTTHSLVYNGVENPYAGDYSYPITFVNCVFGDPIVFKARRTFVSTGTLYGAGTFTADERVRVYSTGDRFCYDGNTLGCTDGTKKNFDRATVIFMTGQPGEGRVQGHPTFFGTDVQFGAPVQLPSLLQNALPQGKPNGSIVYCANCKRNTTPCQANGSGAPAMVVNGQWSCL